MTTDAEQGRTKSLVDLGHDLAVEILHRLPHRDVIRCKCVSKQWLYFISCPNFVSRFLSMKKQLWTFMHPPDETGLALSAASTDNIFKVPGFSLSFLPCNKVQSQGKEAVVVVKTFNDLFLCCRRKRFQRVYYICNPLTKQWVALPPSLYCYENVVVDFTCYKKDSTSQQSNGLAINTQYWCKVVKIFKQGNINQLDLEIFSSQTGQWTKNELSIPTGHYFEVYTIQDAITFDGKLILLGFMGFHSQKNIIISIDNDGGSSDANVIMFGSLDDFNAWSGCPHGPVLSVSQEHLRFAWLTKSTNVPILKIWELKQCQLSLVHEVDFTGIVSDDEWISTIYLKSTFMTMMEERMGSRRNAEDICAPIVLGFDPNDENRVYLNLIYCDRMAKYDIRRRTLNLVPDTCVASFTKSKENVFQVVLPLWPTMVPHLVTPDSSTEHS